MATTTLQRASVFAIVEETTVGTLKAPASGTDFVPLRDGFSQSSEIEELENEEIVNDIGATKSLTGLEQPAGEHPAYLKHSEVEGQAPEIGLLYESAFGLEVVNSTQYDTVAGSTAGTSAARAVINVDTGEGAQFREGQALLIKDGTNGYNIRNVYSISGDALSLSYNLSAAPGSGVNLGKAIQYIPAASGHPSFSAWLYGGNGGYLQAVAGCRVSELVAEMNAGEQATVDFSYAGTSIYWDPIEITSSTKYIDFVDSGGTKQAILTAKIYKSPVALAEEVQTKMDAASVDTITCVWSSTTGKFTITSNSTPLSLLFLTGAQNAASADTKLGFTHTDHTGATTYTSDTEQSWAAGYTPSYDNATNLVVKASELFLGNFSETVCREVSSATLTITVDQEEVKSWCAQSGLLQQLPISRVATLEATLILQKHEAHLFDKFINNRDTQMQINLGQKDSSGNWVPGKCVNFFMPQATFTQHVTGGDTVVEVTLSAKGYISGTKKDIYLNFI